LTVQDAVRAAMGILEVPEPSALIVLIMAGFLFRRSSAVVA
jgi:hypothetical protein